MITHGFMADQRFHTVRRTGLDCGLIFSLSKSYEIDQKLWRVNKRKRCNWICPPSMDLKHAKMCWHSQCIDYSDTVKTQNTLRTSWSIWDYDDPFNQNQPKLCSLSSDLTASNDDGVNCDQTEQIGTKIHLQLDYVSIINASIKRNDQVRSLEHQQPEIQVEKKNILTVLKIDCCSTERRRHGSVLWQQFQLLYLRIITCGNWQGTTINRLKESGGAITTKFPSNICSWCPRVALIHG